MRSIDVGPNAKLVVLLLIGVTACGFSYSLGRQNGRTESTDWFNTRLDDMNRQVMKLGQDTQPDESRTLADGR